MSDDVVANMMAGYRYLDESLEDERDLLAMGQSRRILEFNHCVLCGADDATRAEFAAHLERTEQHFYAHRPGGIGDLANYIELHRGNDAWRLAAGIYIHILSEPQLFIEGNHRAGALIMSYALVQNGKPPFVLTVDNAEGYFNPSTLIKASKRDSMRALIKLPKIRRRFADFLERHTDPQHLRAAD